MRVADLIAIGRRLVGKKVKKQFGVAWFSGTVTSFSGSAGSQCQTFIERKAGRRHEGFPSIMSKVDDGASDAEAIERQELSRVVVSFSGITDPVAIGLRIEDSADIFPLRLDQDEGSWVKVEERPVAVEVAGASAAGLQIGVGMQPISVAWAGQKSQ